MVSDVMVERQQFSPELQASIETPNLSLLRNYIENYQQARNPESIIAEDALAESLAVLHIPSVNGKNIAEFWERTKGLQKSQRGEEDWIRQAKFRPWNLDEQEMVKSKTERARDCTKAIAQLRAVERVIKFDKDRMSSAKENWRQGEITLLEDAEKFYRLNALRAIMNKARQLFREDALLATNLPYQVDVGELSESIARLAEAAASPLRKAYQDFLKPVEKEGNSLAGELSKEDSMYRNYDFYFGGQESIYILAESVRDAFPGKQWKAWEELNPSPEQAKALYDLVAGRWFSDLYAGGHESMSGTHSSSAFSVLRDPRAIPGLIGHLQHFGSGHTSNSVVHTISGIVENPLSREDLDRVVAETDGVKGRILREWFLEPEEWVKKLDGYAISGLAQSPQQYFARGELARLAKRIAAERKIEFTKNNWGYNAYDYLFLGSNFDDPGVVEIKKLLMENLDQTAQVISRSKLNTWRLDFPEIFSVLVNPHDGNYFHFPQLIATVGLGLGPEAVGKLEKLYGTADLRRGAHDRVLFVESLLFLSSKDNGGEIMEAVLAASTGVTRDPARIREIFRMMETLDSFGVFDFSPKGTLAEISSDLRGKVVEGARQRMKLEDSELPALDEKLDYLLQNNLLEIIPTLMAKVSGHGNADKVVEEIGRHIVLGDFGAWRNSLETAQAALSVLPEDEREKWVTPGEKVKVAIRFHDEDETREAAIGAIKRIVEEAKAHIQEVYKLDFSGHRLEGLRQLQQQLIGDIKKSEEVEGKRELGMRKRSVDAEVKMIEVILVLERLEKDSFDPAKVLDMVEKARSAMMTLRGLEQPISDLEQIQKVFTMQQKLTTVSQLTAYDSDDPVALLKAGAEPRETCQSWRQGTYNYCLPAYVADANKRVINVENERGELVGRSIARLTHIRTEAGETIPVILLEPVYTTAEATYVYRAIVQVALAKAKSIGADLVLNYEMEAATGADHTKTVTVLPQEAKKSGFTIKRMPVEVFIPRSYNQHEYSDTLGGDISWFDRYVQIQNAVVVSPSE